MKESFIKDKRGHWFLERERNFETDIIEFRFILDEFHVKLNEFSTEITESTLHNGRSNTGQKLKLSV